MCCVTYMKQPYLHTNFVQFLNLNLLGYFNHANDLLIRLILKFIQGFNIEVCYYTSLWLTRNLLNMCLVFATLSKTFTLL